MSKGKPRSKRKNTPAVNKKPSSNSVAVHHQEYSGPIPPATELAKYNQVVENAAERILVMAEKNQDHTIAIEQKALDATRREARRGQVFAFLITIAAFTTSIIAILEGQPTVAGIIGGTTVVSLAIAFIKGREQK